MKKYLSIIFILIAVIYSWTALTSCKKNGDTIASVKVLDPSGAPVSGAIVTLWQDTAHSPITGAQGTVRVSKQTDGSGNAQFTFANEAFLNIWATDPLYTDTAEGYIRLQQYQTTSATVQF